MLSFLKLKSTTDTITRQFNKNQLPTDELQLLAGHFEALAENDGAILDNILDEEPPLEEQDPSKPFLTKSQLRYILEDCACKMVEKIYRERNQAQGFQQALGDVLKSILLFSIPVMKRKIFNVDFLLGVANTLDAEHYFYNSHFRIPESKIQELITKGPGQAWRNNLKKGDKVDCMLNAYDKQDKPRYAGWAQAEVKSVKDDWVQLRYLMEPRSSNTVLDRWSNELAPFESQTKEDWKWKATLKVGDLIDGMDDCCNWYKSFIREIKDEEDDGKVFPVAKVGFRYYNATGRATDENGKYDGFGEKWDELVPLYSCRITNFNTQSKKGFKIEEGEIDESIDDVIEPFAGTKRSWVVPRPRKCTSLGFLNNLSLFCEAGGLDVMLKSIEEGEFSDKDNEFNVSVLACLFTGAANASIVYHKKVIQEYGKKFVDLSQKKLLGAPDKAMRDVLPKAIDYIMKAVEAFNKRILEKSERKKGVETLKLDLCLLCMKSEFLARRIQGISDLTKLIKDSRWNSSSMDAKQIIQWMLDKQVLQQIFDPVRTHEQIVQRCEEIIKILLSENELTDERLKLFWNLTKSDYRPNVYKIISDCSYSFKTEHLEFFFDQICTGIPAEKLDMDDFSLISELGKFQYNNESPFVVKVQKFFFKIATAAAGYPDEKPSSLEVIKHCSTKYLEMIKYKVNIDKKREMILELAQLIKTGDISSSVACINLLQGIITDQADRDKYKSNTTTTYGSQQQKDITIQEILDEVVEQHDIIPVILDNIKVYCEAANEYVAKEQEIPERSKLFVNYGTYSHHEEVDKRLDFLRFFAKNSDNYIISQKELGVIYDLLVTKSQIASDYQYFLTWCKRSCESGSAYSKVMDFGDVGQFFRDKINKNELNLGELSLTGYEFLQSYFLSINESKDKIEKEKTKSYTSYTGGYNNYSSNNNNYNSGNYTSSYSNTQSTYNNNNNNYGNNNNNSNSDTKKIFVKVPSPELEEIDLLWRLVLETGNQAVVSKVVAFFIQIHTDLHEDIAGQKTVVLNGLIKEIMQRLKSNQVASQQVRLVELLKALINESEKSGASSITPHGALELGETFSVTVKDDAINKHEQEVKIDVCATATLYDLKEEFARVMDFSAKFIRLALGKGAFNRTYYSDSDNQSTLKSLGIKEGDFFIAQKQNTYTVPTATKVALLGDDKKFTPLCRRVFNMLFDMYKEKDDTWSKVSCGFFCKGCIDSNDGPTGQIVTNVFNGYDRDKDDKLQREEFFEVYEDYAKRNDQTVYNNLNTFNVRNDLRKWSEIGDAASVKKEDMPRYFLSTQTEHFESLMSILDNSPDQVALEVWELIQMLQTNHKFYNKVLTLDLAKDNSQLGSKINWAKFFDRSHPYQLLYTLQIVQAVINEGGDKQQVKKAQCTNQETLFSARLLNHKYPSYEEVAKEQGLIPQDDDNDDDELEAQAPIPLKRQRSSVVGTPDEEAALRASWAKQFIVNGGFEYIMNDLLTCKLSQDNAKENQKELNELKYQIFILSVFETFLSAAVSNTDKDKAANIEELRQQRSNASKVKDEEDKDDSFDEFDEDDHFKQLKAALKGDLSVKIVTLINYEALQARIVEIIGNTLGKGVMVYEDKVIVENALNLWVGCLQHDPALFVKFTQQTHAVEFLMKGILGCEHESIRDQFKTILTNLFTTLENTLALEFTLTTLFKNFDKLSGKSDEYIGLFSNALENYAKRVQTNPELSKLLDSDAVLTAVIKRITLENQAAAELRLKAQESANAEQILKDQSKFMLNLMSLAGKILESFDTQKEDQTVSDLIVALSSGSSDESQQQRQGLMMEIFTKFMFPMVFSGGGKRGEFNMLKVIEKKINSKTASKQDENSSEQAAKVAYKVLVGLLKTDISLMSFFMNKCLTPVIDNIDRATVWNYNPNKSQSTGYTSNSSGFVGLRNPACVCYMNSMTQQLFMVPPFRYNILATDDNVPEDIKTYKEDKFDENVLHQWQHTMANLELAQSSDYQAKGFHFAFKDFDGQPTNVCEQKDAQEFIGILMDRLEEGLKKTKRKHLIRSIFGYKTCSQLICPECGKVKNRLEDNLTMSLTVKDLKSIHHSWEKLIEGERIADFTCSGCTKKVDILKRTLLAETPSVLIVHLQRMEFDFETMQNKKMNQYYEFPQELDLKPFSYYEVMKKEGHIKEGEENEEDEPEEQPEKKEGEEEEENPEPEKEDCYEFSLTGVTVHSGSANSGHYWAYACGERDGLRNYNGQPVDHKEAKWYEFNDSRVSPFEISRLKSEAYGGDKYSSNQNNTGFGGGGDSYGQSGYLLIYERKIKKPIKMTRWVDSTEPVEEGQEPEKVEENYFVDYHQAVEPDDKPNKIFHEVLDSQAKFGFEQEVYQPEFFEFTIMILKKVAEIDSNDESIQNLRRKAMQIANKGILEIYASAAQNPDIVESFRVLGQLFARDKTYALHLEFFQYWWNNDKFSYLYELLLDNPDETARSSFGKFINYMVCCVRDLEKDHLSDWEDYQIQAKDSVITMQRLKAFSARFVNHGISKFNSKVAGRWQRFESFLEMLYFFGVSDVKFAEETLQKPRSQAPSMSELDSNSDSAKIGLGWYAKQKFFTDACDFMLGEKSPLCGAKEKRPDMGNYNQKPDFTPLVNLLTIMMENNEVQQISPITEQERAMLLHPEMLKKIFASPSAESFAKLLAEQCKDNYRLSKKIAKMYLLNISSASTDNMEFYMASLKPFLAIEDNYKLLRFEWVFGVADFKSQKTQYTNKLQYGTEFAVNINDKHMMYECPILYPKPSECLAEQIIDMYDNKRSIALKGLTAIMKDDPLVAQFLYYLPPPNYACARYTDWFKPYIMEQIEDNSKGYSNQYQKERLGVAQDAYTNLMSCQPHFDELNAIQMQQMKEALESKSEYTDINGKWLAVSNPTGEIIAHYPPQVVIGEITSDEYEIFTDDTNEFVKLSMYAVNGEWCYSAPTGNFNLAAPTKKYKKGYNTSQSYMEYRRSKHIQSGGKYTDDLDLGIDMNYWDNNKQDGPVLLRVKLHAKGADRDLKVWYRITTKSGKVDGINVIAPVSKRKNHISGGNRRLCESLRILDPSKGYLFEDPNDIEVNLEVTVTEDNSRTTGGSSLIGSGTGSYNQPQINTSGNKKTAHFSATIDEDSNDQTSDNTPFVEEDDLYGDGNNDNAYHQWQASQSGRQNDPQDNNAIEALMALGNDQDAQANYSGYQRIDSSGGLGDRESSDDEVGFQGM